MAVFRDLKNGLLCGVALNLLVLGVTYAQDASIVQPGAPGEASRDLSADEAVKIADTRYSPDDVRFMQDMIPHHHQAVQMSDLVDGRTNRKELVDIAGRINAAQADEIKFMQSWLSERNEKAPDPKAHHDMHMSHKMAGMASMAQMKELAAAKDIDFDALFLTLMIAHHEGAITMVETLHDQPGSAYDPVLFDFTNDIVSDQKSEIKRMNEILAGLSTDARASLKPGFRDAGEAIKNLELVAALIHLLYRR